LRNHRKRSNIVLFFSREFKIVLYSSINWWTEECLGKKPEFAGDTSIGYASQDEDQIKYVINHDLHELGDWSKRWLMSFNPDKTNKFPFIP
jgi:hypothetical protein